MNAQMPGNVNPVQIVLCPCVTPLAYDEFAAAGAGCQDMIDTSAAMRTGTSDEIAEAGAFLLSEHAGFIDGGTFR